ncbi:NADH dehydrogenase [ubiquinone] 1 beta subcomplex subunit 9-like [Bombyx mandarina]|uniref:NADH dehydrogenase [ubiquinone] 1 beta subcomplex subunit 9 n=2 Tax=Bombyx TaxID=7090 RepID=A0A8R2AN63_BOMMO|nr:NADH dehydrogenase [ubiquinone] 1 beta subcomplex subunit 9 [Bombyx mori]XP_028032912.1 NADH dehydrogenase [ubiquinone] 1 beta subcomplex subunit 9-like [Bombyx mandarina]
MSFAPELRSHSQKVCNFYKRAMRTLEAYHVARYVIRYHQVILRNELDKNKAVCDPKEHRRLLRVAENELFMSQHPIPVAKFARSVGIAGGVAYDRVQVIPDWVMDYWHPLEKAHYPEYFKRRECRKCEYIKKWNDGEIR